MTDQRSDIKALLAQVHIVDLPSVGVTNLVNAILAVLDVCDTEEYWGVVPSDAIRRAIEKALRGET